MGKNRTPWEGKGIAGREIVGMAGMGGPGPDDMPPEGGCDCGDGA